ncbi:MAG: molybdenum cofactor guanylyltransferase [Chloroflexi bacterium]|nr:molybdenum cofactor guanylyltransferase [Chloroflexota bacterium]
MRDRGGQPVDAAGQVGPVGVVLAGGRGQRMGGAKAMVELQGRPLIVYALEAMAAAVGEVAVLAKAASKLPSLPGTTVWVEPQTHHHPLVGIRQALALAAGRPVLVCAADMPLVTVELLRRLAAADGHGAPAVIASADGRPQPLLGRYEQAALQSLSDPESAGDRPLIEAVTAIGPRLLEVEDARLLFNVNTPGDLVEAAAMLDRRRAAPTS